MENTKLFVYGTLKKGYSNHSIIQKTTYIGDFISIDRFDLSGYSFPKIYPNDQGKRIKGEIYDLYEQDFIATDMLEGNGSFYRREIRKFQRNNEIIEAWIYIILQPGCSIEVPGSIIDWDYSLTENSFYN
tara:strand:- start:737 stop:1126 length:390 start_codon:yes stop_codon:yes gene_type:complete